MKFRRTVSSVVVSALLAIVVLLAVLHFHVSTYGIEKVRQTIQSLIPQGDHGLDITMDGVDSTLMKGLKINGIHLKCDDGTDAVSIGSADVSLSILGLVGAALGIGSPDATVVISDVTVLVNDQTVEKIASFFSTADPVEEVIEANETVGESISNDTEAEQTSSSKEPFGKLSLSIGVSNLNLEVDYAGIKAFSSGINATMEIGKGYEFKSAALNVPNVKASFDSFSEEIQIDDIRVSLSENLTAYLSVADVYFGSLMDISGISGMGTIQDGTLSAAIYLNDATLDGKDFGINASLNGTTLNASYNLGSHDISYRISINQANGTSEDPDGKVSVENLVMSGSFDGTDGISVNLLSDKIDLSVLDYRFVTNGIMGDLSLNARNLSSLGQITLLDLNVDGLEDAGISKLNSQYLMIDYSYSSSAIGARVRSSVSGSVQNALVGDFSFVLDSNAQMGGDFSLSSLDILVNDIRMKALRDSASLSVSLDGSGALKGEIRSSSDLSASLTFQDKDLTLNLYLGDFRPYEYKGLYETSLASTGMFSSSTAFNGNIIASAKISDEVAAFISSVLVLRPEQAPEDVNLLEVIESGRLSINTAVRDLSVGDAVHSGAVTFESTLDKGVANISTLAITTGNLRLSYEGSFELAELIPDGKLSLQNATDGSELAGAVFSHTRGMKTYEFYFQSPLLTDTSLSGIVDWQNLNHIEAKLDINAPVFGGETLSVDAVATVSPVSLSLSGDKLSLDVGFKDDLVEFNGSIRDLILYYSKVLFVNINSGIQGSFNTKTSEYDISLTEFKAKLPSGLGLGFDLNMITTGIKISKVALFDSKVTHQLDGSFDFSYKDLSSIFKGDSSSLEGNMDFTSKSKGSHLHGSVTDDQFYLDFVYKAGDQGSFAAELSVLGQRDHTFYANADLVWGTSNRFEFKAMYDDKVVTLYDSFGRIGSLHVDDINLVIDFADMILDGSMLLKNESKFMTGETNTQSANITFETKVESIANGIVQVIAGNDYSVDFTLGISDVHLEDGYKVEDSSIDVNLSNGKISLSGNMLNGSYELGTGYIDVEINKDFIFGFKAKGYLGSEIDLLVSDISFPLPFLNQFTDVPVFSFKDGLIEGDILIKGSLPNLSLYGMAYCQSYEMTLFFLPDQILSAKNVAVSFNDHVVSISRTPMAGYSDADGRYFYGDVAVDLVLQETGFESFDVKVNIDKDTPIDFWLPFVGDFEMGIRGDVTGSLEYGITTGRQKFIADIGVSSTLITFRIDEELPDWYRSNMSSSQGGSTMDLDISITTGHDIEFYYPEKDNSFINFTLAEDKTVRMVMEDNKIKMDGGFALKTGQVYYFQNDFIIREGSVDLTERKYRTTGSELPIVLNLTADITDYDSDGNKVVISLILQNATLDNISPRFSSTPMKDENEILAMLGQSVLSSSALDRSLSLSSLASFAATATDALTRVGILESNKSYSISGIVRNSLGLDIFSARSNIISNVIIDALPGDYAGKNDVSMLARYLDGTSIFAGKYITSDWFIKIRLMLKAETNINNTTDLGHFLAKDLILDTEISLDWETPMGTVSIFTNPHELSVFDILDTIGFSVTKQFQF